MSNSTKIKMSDVPADWPVRPLRKGQKAKDRCTCGTCGLSWDDGKVTSMTPTPGARCPFENFHRPGAAPLTKAERFSIHQDGTRALPERRHV